MPPIAPTTSRPRSANWTERRARNRFFGTTYTGLGPGVTERRLRALVFPLMAMGRGSSSGSLERLFLQEAGHKDSALVEEHHREHHGAHRVGVRARRDHRGEDRDEQVRGPAPVPQLPAREHADDREKDQDDREFERQSERKRDDDDEPE